jgi:hypothetical protein
MEGNNNMGRFFDWLAKPLDDGDLTAWYLANNITIEHTELFRDFCLSFLRLIKETYLGENSDSKNETRVGMTTQQKKEHFHWCWNKTIQNFERESIIFKFDDTDAFFFESFFFDVFYNQPDEDVKEQTEKFFEQIFNRKTKKSKSDVEIFTDIYKVLERSLKIN